jgi:hypothetical protein
MSRTQSDIDERNETRRVIENIQDDIRWLRKEYNNPNTTEDRKEEIEYEIEYQEERISEFESEL